MSMHALQASFPWVTDRGPEASAAKRAAVEEMLRDPKCARWTDRRIADACNVGHPYVGRVRAEISPDAASELRVSKNGSLRKRQEKNASSPRFESLATIRSTRRHRAFLHASWTTLTKPRAKRHLRVVDDVDDLDLDRPRTRAECVDGPRPCPWVSCKHHLFLEENAGALLYNFGNKEPHELDPENSCALDIADKGGVSLSDIGALMNVTREAVRQTEVRAIARIDSARRFRGTAARVVGEFVEVESEGGPRRPTRSWALEQMPAETESDEEVESEEPPARISFFSESERADELVPDSVWSMFSRWQTTRGFDCRSPNSKRVSAWHEQRRRAKAEKAEAARAKAGGK